MSRWFRFYDDAINDPKVLRMPEVMRWHWVAVLCIASKNDGVVRLADMPIYMRVSRRKAEEIVLRLKSIRLLDETGAYVYTPHNWNGRQYKSDVSTERVKRFRKRNETVSETPPDTDTDTDTEQKERKKEARATRGAPLPEDWRPSDDDFSYVEKLGLSKPQALEAAEEMKLWAGANSNRGVARKANWSLTFRSWVRRNSKRGTINGQAPPNRFRDALDKLKQHVGEIDGGEERREPPPRLLSNG